MGKSEYARQGPEVLVSSVSQQGFIDRDGARRRDGERRQRLLDATLELHGSAGCASMTVQPVCKLAKVSTRSFYELYADHEELLTCPYLYLKEEILETIGRGSIRGGRPMETRRSCSRR